MSNPDWFENQTPPPAGTKCEVILNGWTEWEKCEILFMGCKNVVLVSEVGVECAWLLGGCEFRPIPELKKINLLSIGEDPRAEDVLMFNPSTWTTLKTVKKIKCVSNYELALDHWNAVKGLAEEPDWIAGYNVTLRFNSGAERTSTKYITWRNVVAIRFDSVKENYEI